MKIEYRVTLAVSVTVHVAGEDCLAGYRRRAEAELEIIAEDVARARLRPVLAFLRDVSVLSPAIRVVARKMPQAG